MKSDDARRESGNEAARDASKESERFAQRVVEDVATALRGALLFMGDRLGLFRALEAGDALTAAELATRTGLHRRYVEEWLGAMATADYLVHDPVRGTFGLPAERAAVLADSTSIHFTGGLLELIYPLVSVTPMVCEAFRSGGGVPESAYPLEMWEAIERLSAPWYDHYLVDSWLPLMPDVEAKLEAGGSALDVGCGSGRAAITLVEAFPAARAMGYDSHAPSIERARANARAAGVADRVTFEVVDGAYLPAARDFDLVTTFQVVHDATDPLAVVRAIRSSLAPGGTYLMVEQNLSERVEENHTLVGRLMYPMSTLYCMTTSLSHGGAGTGACMGEHRVRHLAEAAGFGSFRRLRIERPIFPVMYELRP
jgi:SAM-dependent methyltransferase